MKQRLLIVEPSELIIEGLKSILDGQIRFKVLEPEMSADHLEERLLAAHPDIVLMNPTLVDNPTRLRGDQPLALVALVYQYVERDVLKNYDAVVDIRDSRAVILETLAQVSPGEVDARLPMPSTSASTLSSPTARTSPTRPASRVSQASPSTPCSTTSSTSPPSCKKLLFLMPSGPSSSLSCGGGCGQPTKN